MDWKKHILEKFQITLDKIEILTQSVDNHQDYNPIDMAGHLKDILEILDVLDNKIDDLQNQIDKNSIKPSLNEIRRMENYELDKKVIEEIFPYLHCFYQYYKGKSNQSENE